MVSVPTAVLVAELLDEYVVQKDAAENALETVKIQRDNKNDSPCRLP